MTCENLVCTLNRRYYYTSALKPSSSGTSATVALPRIRESKHNDVIMICVRGCWDAIFSVIYRLWSPDGSSESVSGEDALANVQSSFFSFAPLTFNHKLSNKCSLFGVGTSEVSKVDTKEITQKIKVHWKTNPKIKTVLIHSRLQAVRFEQPHGSSKSSYSSFFHAYNCCGQRAKARSPCPFPKSTMADQQQGEQKSFEPPSPSANTRSIRAHEKCLRG